MRLRRAALAGALAIGLALAGCTPAADAAGEVVVTGKFGTGALAEFETPLTIDDPSAEVILAGAGADIDEGDPVVLVMSAFSGASGAMVDGRTGTPRVLFATEEDLGETLFRAVVNVREGSRLLVTQPVRGHGGIEMQVTVVDVMPTVATGEKVSDGDERVGVQVDAAGHPAVVIAQETPPAGSLRIGQLIRGDGPQVRPGQDVVAQYTAWTWADGAVLDSTWEEGAVPAVVDLSEAVPGFQNGVADQHVGSRVVLEIPPEHGIGTDAVVMVVDILAAFDPAA